MTPPPLNSVPRMPARRPATQLPLRVHVAGAAGSVGRLSLALGKLEAQVVGLEAFVVQSATTADGGQDLTVYVSRAEHEAAVRELVGRLEGFEVIDLEEGGTSLAPAEQDGAGHHPIAS